MSNIIELPSLAHPDAWEEPVHFDEINTPDIPAKLLPGTFGEFAAALANATETPEALSVMVILGVIATAAAKQFCVSPKEGWQEPVNIYTLIGLPPANNKSLVLNSCTKPLVLWEQQQALLLQPEIKRQQSERKTQEKIIENLRMKAAKAKDLAVQKELISEIAQLEASLGEPCLSPILFANDATPESLAMSAHEQGGRFALFSDEGGIIETLAGLYSNGVANVDILLKGIDGGDIRVRRKDRNFNLNPFLTIVLAVQPAIIQTMGMKRAYAGNGTLERFLYVLPPSKLGYRTHDKPAVPAALQQAYLAKIQALLDLSATRQQEQTETCVLTLAPAAQQAWRTFQSRIELQLRPNGQLAACQGWGGKLCGFALRIAGLLQIAEHGQTNLIIQEAVMNHALTIATLLIEHAIAAYGLMGVDQTHEDAKEVFRWIVANGELSFHQSTITLAMRNKKLGKAERLNKALCLLIDRHLISPPQLLPTRKPTTIYYVHPSILQLSSNPENEKKEK